MGRLPVRIGGRAESDEDRLSSRYGTAEMNRQDKIVQWQSAGDFAGAEKRPRKWTVEEPDEMWSWLMLRQSLADDLIQRLGLSAVAS